MKKILIAALFSFAVLPAFAADAGAAATDAPKAKTAQQQRMSDCNAQAKDKSGAERKTFMSSCLKGGTAAAGPDADKKAACEAAAVSKAGKPLTGAAKNSSVQACLKKAS